MICYQIIEHAFAYPPYSKCIKTKEQYILLLIRVIFDDPSLQKGKELLDSHLSIALRLQ